MPPKPKFTREEVVEAALKLVEEKGTGALTARSLGAALKSSARPIFTTFENGMEEVTAAAEHAAREVYNGYVREGLKETLPFRGVGRAYIRFSIEKPKLFQWLFMRERKTTLKNVLPVLDDSYGLILASVQNTFGLGEEDAEKVYMHLWIYSHGIASLCATKMCDFTNEEIDTKLSEVCQSIVKDIKAKNGKQ